MDWLRDHAWETWLGLSIVLGVLEMFSLDFVLLMLAAGAAVLSLAVVRPTVVKRLHQGPDLKLGHTKLIGRHAVVLNEITSSSAGLIKLDGEEWTARPYDESLIIAAGDAVEVLEIRGATALVHPVPRLES